MYIACKSNDAAMSRIYVKDRMRPGQTMALQITVQLPIDLKDKYQISLTFNLEKDTIVSGGRTLSQVFGYELTGIIDLIDDSALQSPT